MRRGVFRGGKVHVMAEKCATCIFRPGNLMLLRPGRVREMVETALSEDHVIVCHKTLEGDNAVCRGLFDAGKISVLQLAERLGAIEWQKDGNGDDHQDDGRTG